MITVSVIIPCYNQGTFLNDAIASVEFQTYKNWEIILVNDGSTDPLTIELFNKIEHPQIKKISTDNRGLPAARNTGIKNATGKYILPLDADDKIGETYLEKSIDILSTRNDVKLVYCNGRYFGVDNSPIASENSKFSFTELLLYNSIFCSAVFRKEDAFNVGNYNENMKGGWEDWGLWIRLLNNGGEVYKIPEELFFYRQKQQSMIQTVKNNAELMYFLEKQLFVNNLDTYINTFGNPVSVYRELTQLRKEKTEFEQVKNTIYNSASYKLGHALLYPIKKLKGLLQK